MSALKNNPFLVGFGVVMLLGVGALGYLTYNASDEHATAREEFDNASAELRRLQTLKPYPNEEHVKKFAEQKQQLQEKVTGLQKSLASIQIKEDEISPTGFQDRLRETLERMTARLGDANVKLPEKFALGFATYQSQPPRAQAAPFLLRDLRAMEIVMNLIIEVKNVEVREVTREEIAEEKDNKPAPDPKKGGRPAKGDEKENLVRKDRFTIKLATTPENFQRILNGIVTNKEQFFIPRYIALLNEKLESPSKIVAAPPLAPEPPPAGTPPGGEQPAVPEAPKLEYVFGKELVEATIDIDIVDVKEPDAPAPVAGKGKTAERK